MKKVMSLILFFLGIFYFAGAFGDSVVPSPDDPTRGCPCITSCPTNNQSCCPPACPCPPPCPCPSACPCPAPIFCQSCAFGGAFSFDINGNVTGTNGTAFSVTSIAPQVPDARSFRVVILTPVCLLGGVTVSSDSVTNVAAVRAVTNNSFVVGLSATAAGTVNFVVAPGISN